MAAICPHPNCGKTVSKQDDGTYPEKCPHCGLLLRARAKKSRPVAKPASPPATSKPAGDDPFGIQKPARKAKQTQDNPFAKQELDNPFGGGQESNPFETAPAKANNPFGDASGDKALKTKSSRKPSPKASATIPSTPTARKVYEQKTDYSKVVSLAVVALVMGGVGYFIWTNPGLFGGGSRDELPTFSNPSQNYALYLSDDLWKRNEAREKQDKFDLVFEHTDTATNGWFTLRSGQQTSALSTLGGLSDQLLNRWKQEMSSVEASAPTQTSLAEKEAVQVTGTGDLFGLAVKREAYLMIDQGLWYELIFNAVESDFANLATDFHLVRDKFTILGKRPGWEDVDASQFTTHYGTRAPYSVSAPAGEWKANPDFNAESRYSDTKLVGPDYASVVVVPRQTSLDLKSMIDNYMRFKRRRFDGPNQVTEKPREEGLTIDGLPAQKLNLLIEKLDGPVLQVVTFIRGETFIYIVECECPVTRADIYRPKFTKITNTFQKLDAIVGKTPEKPQTDQEMEEPSESRSMEIAKVSSREAINALASQEIEPPPMTEADKKLAESYPSLDELNFTASTESSEIAPADSGDAPPPTPASTEPKTEKKEKPTEEMKKEEDDEKPKKRRSLDDLG